MHLSWLMIRRLGWYLLRSRIKSRPRPPLVLMLEPLFACNLHCRGCGRVREYAAVRDRQMSLDDCLASASECDAPVVSVCGGEPLLYQHLEGLVRGLVEQGRFVYLCTNGLLMDRWVDRLPVTPQLVWNVHLDGMEATHDAITGHSGAFREAVRGIREAKRRGMRVTTNTTVYADTDLHEVVVLFQFLGELGVDGMLISPAYAYPSVTAEGECKKTCQAEPPLSPIVLGGGGTVSEATRKPAPPEGETLPSESPFLCRADIQTRFRSVVRELKRFRLLNSPLYLEFLCGSRVLPCAAWSSPTRNVCGWKSPCYLLMDAHFSSFREWQEKTPWDSLGPGRDPRCENCLVHYGFEPAAVLAAQHSLKDLFHLARWHLATTLK